MVVVPSPNETFCLSLAEALMANVPVAAVDSPGSRWLTDDGRLLDLAPPTAAALAGSMLSALSSSEAERDARRAFVESRFNAGVVEGLYRTWAERRVPV